MEFVSRASHLALNLHSEVASSTVAVYLLSNPRAKVISSYLTPYLLCWGRNALLKPPGLAVEPLTLAIYGGFSNTKRHCVKGCCNTGRVGDY
jgi:hypothetical protein